MPPDRLGCERAGDLAAIAVVSGTIMCRPERPLPVLAIHGTADPVIPYVQGFSALSLWAELAGCHDSPRSVPLPPHGSDGTSVQRVEFPICATELRLLRVEGGGHSWPGAPTRYPAWTGRQSDQIDASEEILSFFDRHR